MVDTFYPLKVAKNALNTEDPNYTKSWIDGDSYKDTLGD